MERLKPHLQLAETVGGLVSQLSGGQVQELELRARGFRQPSLPAAGDRPLKGLLGRCWGTASIS